MLKKSLFLLSILYSVILAVASLLNINEVVKEIPSFNDKVAHLGAYFVLTALWFLVLYYTFNFKFKKALIITAVFSFIYGALIEGLQGWLTLSREADFKDLIANTLGVIFAVLLIMCLKNSVLKKTNTLLF